MGAGSHAVPSGVVLGLALVVLAQQVGLVDLSSATAGVLDFVVAAVLGGIAAGIVGRALGRRAARRRGARPWTPPASDAAAGSEP